MELRPLRLADETAFFSAIEDGGVLENKMHEADMRCAKRRYWIEL